jgi:riboflavin kinase/FMN adenylyltransferase
MQVLRQPVPLPPGTAACVGAFDGLHLGHQALLRRARVPASRASPWSPSTLTLPCILAPARAPAAPAVTQLSAPASAPALGVETLVLLPFDRALADTSPEGFVERLLVDGPAPRDRRRRRRLPLRRRPPRRRVRELAELLRPAAIAVAAVAAVPVPWDMSDPRQAQQLGDPRRRGRRRGRPAPRPCSAAGTASRAWSCAGAGRGRELGVRTANVDAPTALLPRAGIYAGALGLPDGDAAGPWPAAISLGQNPTFVDAPAAPLVLEVHALDQDLGDSLYGRTVEVAFAARLRDEQRFPGPALRAQIGRDIAAVRPPSTPPASPASPSSSA